MPRSRATIDAYFKAVNEAGGINGRKIKFISLDDGYSPPKTVEVVRQLVEQDKIFALFQPLGTPCNTAIHKYMNQRKVPQLFVATGASKWGDPKNFPWTMGFQPDYHTEAVIYAKHILANVKDAKIAVLHQNDDYGRDYLGGFKEGLGKEAGRIVRTVTYEATDPTVDSQIIQLKDSGANVFFNVSAPKAAAQGIRKAAEIDWKPVHYLNNVSASVAAVMKPAGFDNAQGIITAAYIMDATDKAWDNNEEMKAWRAWMDKNMPQANKADAQPHLRLRRRRADDRDAEALRQRDDARQPDEAGGELPEVPPAAAAARHHRQHQRDGLLSHPGGPASALQGRDLGAVRRGHARREHLTLRCSAERRRADPRLAGRSKAAGFRRPFLLLLPRCNIENMYIASRVFSFPAHEIPATLALQIIKHRRTR